MFAPIGVDAVAGIVALRPAWLSPRYRPESGSAGFWCGPSYESCRDATERYPSACLERRDGAVIGRAGASTGVGASRQASPGPLAESGRTRTAELAAECP